MLKTDFYAQLTQQTSAIIGDEKDIIANMANISALLFDALDKVNWVGFYRVVDQELVLGPFQGKIACIRIPVGKGVCGTAVSENKTQRIADVHQFSGHIACDAASNSEIVIPVVVKNQIIAVLDIDSVVFDRFDEDDQKGLETIVEIFSQAIDKAQG
ncbi:GAF domain-containing protein [Thalassotalea castellviae]|uniref:GAF domain-containing protein n=1 Tax=Thalassotalea castellviae TaxID=3075612 RepID=A0ABU2ZWM9_9GAMM|nr:GAF domain-containing protein [Thalassotalea sp. W431]MDT0602114.1 GAF domain-containing protein [Thalassotalea sp. W431]